MGLNRFQQCDRQHSSKLEYCCLKSNRVFCQNCWFREGHSFKCHSTRCGHYEKLSHLVIDKTLQIKTMHYVSEMSPDVSSYRQFTKRLFQLKEILTQSMMADIQNKAPLFLWSMAIEMLGLKKSGGSDSISHDQDCCSEMLKIIKGNRERHICLEKSVDALEKVSILFEDFEKKVEKKQFKGNKGKEVGQVIDFYQNQAGEILGNVKVSIKKHIQHEVKRVLQKFDPAIKFDGVKFASKPSYENSENFPDKGLYLKTFPQIISPNPDLYRGMDLSIDHMENSPETLLECARSFLKEKVYNIYESIKGFKSAYPYKYAYVMATTVKPDEEYEEAIIMLEQSKLRILQKKSAKPFLNSINIVIMGPELITIRFKSHPKLYSTEVNIYGAVEGRKTFYYRILSKILKNYPPDKKQVFNMVKHQFDGDLSPVGLVYAQFELAYQHLFDQEGENTFEGEKYAQARGSKLFVQIAQNWKANNIIDFSIGKDRDALITEFI